jgi:hypothetical protein
MVQSNERLLSLESPVFFGGHETFPFRYGWLKKGVDAVSRQGTFFSSDRAMIGLGVGKNMVKSIKHWCLATNLIQPASDAAPGRARTNYVPTQIGKALVADSGFDPFLEDPATLWLLHWQLASNSNLSTTWFWLFNHWHGVEFTKEQVFSEIQKWLRQKTAKNVSESQLKRDIDCCVRCYLHSHQGKDVITEESFDCPLSELGLIVESEDGRTFQFRRGEQSTLPTEILLYALTEFCQRDKSSASSIALSRLLSDVGSPGKIFKLDETSLVRRLEEIETTSDGVFVYGESANIKQVYRRRDVSSIEWLKKYYLPRAA